MNSFKNYAHLKVGLALVCFPLWVLLLNGCGSDTPTALTVNSTTTQNQPGAVPATSLATTTTSTGLVSVAGNTPSQTTLVTQTTTTTGNTNPATSTIPGFLALDTEGSSYLDDRSDPVALIRSYYNALNRKEAVRAWGYWGTSGSKIDGTAQTFSQFSSTLNNTTPLSISLGSYSSQGAAGTFYFQVPVIVSAGVAQNVQQTAWCYTIRQPNPSNFGNPPFEPLSLEAATSKPLSAGADLAQVVTGLCPVGAQTIAPATPNPALSAAAPNFVDDRSTPTRLVVSFYNAINLKQYVRAYSYRADAAKAPAGSSAGYDKFSKGFATTISDELTTGEASGKPGGSSEYFTVPVVVRSTLSDGQTQTFEGCYEAYLPNPQQLTQPPFSSMVLSGANVKAADNSSDTTTLIAQAKTMCQTLRS